MAIRGDCFYICVERGEILDMKIRKVTKEDLDMIANICTECFPSEEADTKEALKQRIKTFPETFYVVEIDNKVIGDINGPITNENAIYDELFTNASLHVPTGQYQVILTLEVLPEYRGQGIAEKLLNHMIEISRSDGRKGVILTCKKHLIKYYEKFGFKNKGISQSKLGGAVWYDMILEF